jgi:hypothetical protein
MFYDSKTKKKKEPGTGSRGIQGREMVDRTFQVKPYISNEDWDKEESKTWKKKRETRDNR